MGLAIEEVKRYLNSLNPDDTTDYKRIDTLREICKPLIFALQSSGVSCAPKLVNKAHKKYGTDPQVKHTLNWVEISSVFNCDGCEQDGWGSRYECERCDKAYDPRLYHQVCAEANPTASYESFKGASLTFYLFPDAKHLRKCSCASDNCTRKCNACGMLIKGMVYYCKEEDMALHPMCVKLEKEISFEVASDKSMKFLLSEKMADRDCAYCKRKKMAGCKSTWVPAWSYASDDGEFHLHVYCAMRMLSKCTEKGKKNKSVMSKYSKEEMEKRVSLLEKKKHKKGDLFLKIMLCLLKEILGMLIGDPITPLFTILVDFLFNLS